jgi:hypothetical protein
VNRRLLPAAALCLAALFGLAGCGQATQAPETTVADDPAPTSGSSGGGVSGSTGGDTPVSSDPDSPSPGQSLAQSLAQWPAKGCDSRSVMSVDYGRMPPGYRTPEEAVENSPAGLPAGDLELAPYAGKGPAQVWVLDPSTEEIQAQVSVFRGPDGWFVDGVTTCA